MKNLKKLMVLSAAALVLSACGGNTPSSSSEPGSSSQPSSEPSSSAPAVYSREANDAVYDRLLSGYEELINAAKAEEDNDVRFVKYAKAEAALLDAAVFVPTTTQGGTFAITRVAPHTVPFANWGNDSDRLKGLVLAEVGEGEKIFIKSSERNEMIDLWTAARQGNSAYDPAAYLTSKGYTIAKNYTTTFSTKPETLDILATSMQSDTEPLVNAIEGLLEYDNLGNLKPNLAASYELSENKKVYTFHLRNDAKWYTADKQVYAPVKAQDFVDGIRHMMDAQEGLEFLVDEVVVGCDEYMYDGGSFDDVGVKAIDDYTLQIELCNPEPFFLTRLEYSCFMPLCGSFFKSRGGVFGIDEWANAVKAGTVTFGQADHPESQVYNGPFIPQTLNDETLLYVKNEAYWNASNVTLNSIQWVADSGENGELFWQKAKNGTYAGCGLNETLGTLAYSKAEGLFDDYHYVTDTNATTYFNGYNVNRGTFENGTVKSSQSEEQKIATHNALQNNNFRRALQQAWDRTTHNAVSVGEEVAALSLRNMYTQPIFLSLDKDVTFEGHTFSKATFYGDMVEYFLKNDFNRNVELEDGQDGWYNPEAAKAYLAAAKAEMGADWQPVVIDIVYYDQVDGQVAQAAWYKKCIEDVLGAENVTINTIGTSVKDDYFAAGYRAKSGATADYDNFYGSGWGPDYGDPSTYLDTFNWGGYMLKVVGLSGQLAA